MSKERPYAPAQNVPYVVKMGRSGTEVRKTMFMVSKKQAIDVANAIAFILWSTHPFDPGPCSEEVRVEAGGYWLLVKPA